MSPSSKAEPVLADRTHFVLAAERRDRFVEALDRPPQQKPGLERLFSKPSVFATRRTWAYRRPEPLGKRHRLAVAPRKTRRRAHSRGLPCARPVPAILLARLAADRRHQRAGLGRSLLQDVLLRCVDAAEVIGGCVLLVHAKHDEAKAWYRQYDFEESPRDPLHLVMLMKDVRASLQRSGAAS